MSGKNLNIISFDIPYPPDYGGVIEVFFKIKALSEAGVKIHLHCFEYGRQRRRELEKFCASVHYYPRKTAKSLLFNGIPYIVLSRSSEQLKKNLSKNSFPVLMEGLHSTYHLHSGDMEKRKTIVRMHNIEHEYYDNLALVESNIFKRYYFHNEAAKLRKYEDVLRQASAVAAISQHDTGDLGARFRNVYYIPAFHPHENPTAKKGRGAFAFYHGNLAVGENNQAAIYLAEKIFNSLKVPLVIAGSKPSKLLIEAAGRYPNITLKADISTSEIYELVRDAQVNILPTFQNTGIKLKLLAALFTGRHCIVNTPMVKGTGLETLCAIADSPRQMKEKISQLFNKDFDGEEIRKRESVLQENFSNRRNAGKLSELIFQKLP